MIDTNSNSQVQFAGPIKQGRIVKSRRNNSRFRSAQLKQVLGQQLQSLDHDLFVKRPNSAIKETNPQLSSQSASKLLRKEARKASRLLKDEKQLLWFKSLPPDELQDLISLGLQRDIRLQKDRAKKIQEGFGTPGKHKQKRIDRLLARAEADEQELAGRLKTIDISKVEATLNEHATQNSNSNPQSTPLTLESSPKSQHQIPKGIVQAFIDGNKYAKSRLNKWAKKHQVSSEESKTLLNKAKALHENAVSKADGLITQARAIIDRRFTTGQRANQIYKDEHGNLVTATSTDSKFTNGKERDTRVMLNWRMPGSVENLHTDIDQTLQELPSGDTKTKLASIKDEVQGLVTPVSVKEWATEGIRHNRSLNEPDESQLSSRNLFRPVSNTSHPPVNETLANPSPSTLIVREVKPQNNLSTYTLYGTPEESARALAEKFKNLDLASKSLSVIFAASERAKFGPNQRLALLQSEMQKLGIQDTTIEPAVTIIPVSTQSENNMKSALKKLQQSRSSDKVAAKNYEDSLLRELKTAPPSPFFNLGHTTIFPNPKNFDAKLGFHINSNEWTISPPRSRDSSPLRKPMGLNRTGSTSGTPDLPKIPKEPQKRYTETMALAKEVEALQVQMKEEQAKAKPDIKKSKDYLL